MKYRKLVENLLPRSSNNSQVAIALVAGMAAGAVLSILFAPDKGSSTRRNIANKAGSLSDGIKNSYTSMKNRMMGNHRSENEAIAPEVPHFTHAVTKRRKSDINSLVSEAHHNDQNSASSENG